MWLKNLGKLIRSCILLVIVAIIPATCLAVEGDYDGDDSSDLTVALVDREANQSAFLSLNLNSGQYAQFSVFNVPGDALVAGKWWPNDGRTFPGLVYVRPGQQLLEWHLQTPWQSQVTLGYGLAGDTIPAQADFDCDGITDLSVIRQNFSGDLAPFKIWYIRSSANGFQTTAELFGLKEDRAMVADMDGDGCSEMVLLRPGSYLWFTKKFGQADYAIAQWGLDGDYPVTPADIDGDGKSEYIIARDTPEGQLAFVRSQDNTSQVFRLGNNGSIPMVGKFKGQMVLGWQDRASQQFFLRNPDGTLESRYFGLTTNTVLTPAGNVIQPSESGRFPETRDPNSTNGCIHTGGPTDFRDGRNGALWKPHSEGVPNGAPAILLDNMSYCGARMTILDRNGDRATGIQKNHCRCINGCRPHWWAADTAGTLARKAPLTVKIEIDGRTECRRVPDPRQRYD